MFCDAQLVGGSGILQLVVEAASLSCDDARIKAYFKLLSPGSTVVAMGMPGCDREGTLSLYLTHVTLQRCNPAPAAVLRVVDLAATGVIEPTVACAALACEEEVLAGLVSLSDEANDDAGNTACSKQLRYEFKQAVLSVSRALQGLPPERRIAQRRPRLSQADALVLQGIEARVVRRWSVQPGRLASQGPGSVPSLRVSAAVNALLDDSHSLREPSACCCRGPGTRSEYHHGKKRPQVEWMLSEICALVEDLLGGRRGNEAATIVDIGGGRGDLALCVAAALPHCQIKVVDTNEKSIADGKARAEASGVHRNMDFLCADASSVIPALAPDLIIGLHACGGLTDLILDMAARPLASDTHPAPRSHPAFLVVPCCFHRHPHLRCPSCDWTRQGRGGPLSEEEISLLQRLAESPSREISCRAMLVICQLRLLAVDRARGAHQPQGTGGANLDVNRMGLRLLEFSPDFSLRNLVLCGDGRPSCRPASIHLDRQAAVDRPPPSVQSFSTLPTTERLYAPNIYPSPPALARGLSFPRTSFQGTRRVSAVKANGGLGNKLRVLLSYREVVVVDGDGHLVVVWANGEDCPARFDQLFEPIPGVTVVDATEPNLDKTLRHIGVTQIKNAMATHPIIASSKSDREAKMYLQLQPIAAISSAIAECVARCRDESVGGHYIAVHVRRTDHAKLFGISTSDDEFFSFVDKVTTGEARLSSNVFVAVRMQGFEPRTCTAPRRCSLILPSNPCVDRPITPPRRKPLQDT